MHYINSELDSRIVEKYGLGLSIHSIARNLYMSPSSVRNALYRNSVNMRKLGRNKKQEVCPHCAEVVLQLKCAVRIAGQTYHLTCAEFSRREAED